MCSQGNSAFTYGGVGETKYTTDQLLRMNISSLFQDLFTHFKFISDVWLREAVTVFVKHCSGVGGGEGGLQTQSQKFMLYVIEAIIDHEKRTTNAEVSLLAENINVQKWG